MNVFLDMGMRKLMTDIVNATHSITNNLGDPRVIGTIPQDRLRMAAIVAIQIATAEEIWPGDTPIRIETHAVERHGIFEIKR